MTSPGDAEAAPRVRLADHGLAGLASGAVGVAVGQLLAWLIDPGTGPLTAVGAVAVDLVPAWLKEFGIALFGTLDKVVLQAVVAVAVGALAWGAGLAGARSARRGGLALAALGGLGVAAAVTRDAAALPALLPSVAATLTAVVGYRALRRRLPLLPAAEPAAGAGGGTTPAHPRAAASRAVDGRTTPALNRRTFLTAAGGAITVAVTVVAATSRTGAAPSPVDLPTPATPLGPLPAGLDTTGVTPLRTPQSDFYRIDIALLTPRIDVADWRLTIAGMVAAPYSLTWPELIAHELVERDITLTCVSNEVGGDLVGSGRWLGVPLAPLLRRARPHAGADQVLSHAADGFTASTPLDVLLDGRDTLLAIALNGEPLTPTHGAPVRLITPGLYGYVGATKWLTELNVSTFAADPAYWTRRGWGERGPVKTASRIDTPRRGATVDAGQVVLGGVAWATHRGVAGVQVRLDDGPWQPAELGAEVGIDYWRQWRLTVTLPAGRHRAQVRAIDGSGAVQTGALAPVVPDGATGWHTVEFTTS